ncbi:hypothetical protein LMANV2_240026 [Leptospira interrogans serovar Manilae]|uniref:Uncharacterized protein n=2 Tax=Leptospira interrogans TaxID=173 RepID=A0AAQ1NYH7_LEPIR|nr:hypothetical protein G436_1060 [Leptospira interrogans serovar Hardjo str. Norma]SOR60974.1 hypothetical protein LMANV2_240026 [Leptospira interrogans serovar Manilae]
MYIACQPEIQTDLISAFGSFHFFKNGTQLKRIGFDPVIFQK